MAARKKGALHHAEGRPLGRPHLNLRDRVTATPLSLTLEAQGEGTVSTPRGGRRAGGIRPMLRIPHVSTMVVVATGLCAADIVRLTQQPEILPVQQWVPAPRPDPEIQAGRAAIRDSASAGVMASKSRPSSRIEDWAEGTSAPPSRRKPWSAYGAAMWLMGSRDYRIQGTLRR